MFELPAPEMSFSALATGANAIVFGSAGLLSVAALRPVRRVYAGWDIPAASYVVLGLLEILTAAFLLTPGFHGWGVALAALIAFGTVVLLLDRGQYISAVPVMLLMVVLAAAWLSSPVSHEHIRYIAELPVRAANIALVPEHHAFV